MTDFYFDASALIKRYAREPGSQWVARTLETADGVFTCKVAFAEILATFRRKRDEVGERGFDVETMTTRFQEDWAALSTVDLTPELFAVVHRLAFRHTLRALDLLHLSAAVLLRDGVGIVPTFACSDLNLLEAARRGQLDVFDPRRDP